MADSEHDEMYEDAELGQRGRAAEEDAQDSRRARRDQVQGGFADSMDADMLRDDLIPLVMGALRASGADSAAIRATNELSVVPFGVDTKGMIEGQGGSIHTLITVSHPNQTAVAALGHVTKDGGVSVLGATIIAESYISATARAMATFGRAEERKHEQKKAGTYVIVRGIGAIDDTNLDAHADAMAAFFGAIAT
eukprot:518366-Prymnesium_polylepis.1